MRASFGYFGGLLVGAAMSQRTPKELVGNWAVWALGVFIYLAACAWPTESERIIARLRSYKGWL